MTRRSNFKRLRKKPVRDASYEDGDQWEWARKNFPIKIPPIKATPQPKTGSVEVPPNS